MGAIAETVAAPWLVVAVLGAVVVALIVVIVGMGIDLSATRRRERAANQRLIERAEQSTGAKASPSAVRVIDGGVLNVVCDGFVYFRVGARLMRAPLREDGTFRFGDADAPSIYDDDPAVLTHVIDALDVLEVDALRHLATDA